MKVFISWSGSLSAAVAKSLREWLPNVIQSIDPFMSEGDIQKGERSMQAIAESLESTDFGIIVLTPDNITSPWVNFEAGALSKQLEKARVVPLLVSMTPSDVTGPLTQFQMATFDKESVYMLVESINDQLQQSTLAPQILSKSFEKFWDDLEQAVKESVSAHSGQGIIPARSTNDLLNELVTRTRDIQQALSRPLRMDEELGSVRALQGVLVTTRNVIETANFKKDSQTQLMALSALCHMLRALRQSVPPHAALARELRALLHAVQECIERHASDPSEIIPEDDF